MLRARDGRHAPIAASLTGLSPAAASGLLIGRDVLLDWAPTIERTRSGAALIRTTANLVVRFCPQVRLRQMTALAAEVAGLLVDIDGEADPTRAPSPDALLVHLGGGAEADVTGSADGWVAHVSGFGEVVPVLRDTDVIVGAHAAAALVASQVFARALPLNPTVAGPSRRTAYSVLEYGAPTVANPRIGEVRIERALLAGIGAVGQAAVDVLVGSDSAGLLDVVDFGSVDDVTNLNRSVLAVEDDLLSLTAKVQLAVRRAAGSPLVIEPHECTVEEIVDAYGQGRLAWPHVAISALDNGAARRALQSLWPDLVLDGATGGTLAQVFRHRHGERTACLRCLHAEEPGGGDYLGAMATATGIDRDRLAAGLAGAKVMVTERDIETAPSSAHDLIARHVGGDICGLLADAERYLDPKAEPVQLSVAFTSYLAGTFLAGELIKAVTGLSSPLGRYQIDPLANLDPEGPFSQAPLSSCFCQVRADVISAVRSAARRPTV
jgi:hypothetical protein